MKVDRTKKLIADAIKQAVKTTSLKKLTVQDLCDRCQINRGTFYYHFRDIPDLICWIYHTEVTIPVQEMIRSRPRRHMSVTLYMLQKAYENKEFYYQALSDQGQNNLWDFAMKESEENWKLMWETYLHDKKRSALSDSGIQYVLKYFADAHHYAATAWIKNGRVESPEQVAMLIDSASEKGISAVFEQASS